MWAVVLGAEPPAASFAEAERPKAAKRAAAVVTSLQLAASQRQIYSP